MIEKATFLFRSNLALCLILAAGSVLSSCGGNNAQAQNKGNPPPPRVEVVEVRPAETSIYAEYPAQTYARDRVEIRGRVDGYVEQWRFRPGQFVKAGEVLYVLDLRPYQAQVQQAEGNLQQAHADLLNAQQQTSLLQAEANLAAARANLVRAQQDHERLIPLVAEDAAAKQDLDAAVATLRSAESNVRANEAAVTQARLNTQTQIQSTEGRVQTQTASLRTARLNLGYATITSPISGLVGDTQVPIGGLVTANASQPLTTVVPLDPIWVRFQVSEASYLAFQRRRGGAATERPTLHLVLAGGAEFPYEGHIENTLNQVDPRTGTLEVQAKFPNPQRLVLPGQFARVRFETERRENALMIPQRAVQQNQSIQTVFVVGNGNKIAVRPVRTGPRVGDKWVIEKGLQPGDRVVVEGVLTVRPGAVVTPEPFKNDVGQRNPPAGNAQKGGD